MGKINVSLLRYLNTEDYRVLTAVSNIVYLLGILEQSLWFI